VSVLRRSAFVAGTLASAAALTARAQAAQWSYRYAHNLPVGHPLHIRTVQMWREVREATGGRLDVTVFPNNQLGADPSALAQLRSGAIQFFTASGGLLGGIVPVAQIENVGFAFPDAAAALRAMDGELGALVRGEIAGKGLVALERMWDNGMRQVTSSTKPILAVDDLAGFKIRTPPSALWVDLFRTLGAAPTPISGAELYLALQTHVVDGQENALAGIEATRLYEVQKYLSFTNHMFAGYWMLANADAWRALPPDVQAVVERANARWALAQRRDLALLNVSLADKLQRRGMTLHRVAQRPFREKLRPFYAKWKAEFGERAWTALERSAGALA
jgi:tripartite ATP-independent transporter DctP family solute receptor